MAAHSAAAYNLLCNDRVPIPAAYIYMCCARPRALHAQHARNTKHEEGLRAPHVAMQAETKIFSRNENKEYLAIEGLEGFRKATVDLLLGDDHPAIKEVRGKPVRARAQHSTIPLPASSQSMTRRWSAPPWVCCCLRSAMPRALPCPVLPRVPGLQGRVACVQSLSGTGSLRVGAAFAARFIKGKPALLSNPTWGNHRNIFGDEGVEWKYYRCAFGGGGGAGRGGAGLS